MTSLIVAFLLILSKQEPAKGELVEPRVDASKQYQYALPAGWEVMNIKGYAHDLVVLPAKDGMKRNILVLDESTKPSLTELKAVYERKFPKAFKDCKLVRSEIVPLDKKREAVRIIVTHTTPGVPVRQVDYIVDVGAKRYFVTGTVLMADGDKYDKVFDEFAKGIGAVAK